MMRSVALLGLCAALCGCSTKLDFQKATDVGAGEAWSQVIEAFKSDTKVKLDVTATEPVDVFVMAEEDVNKDSDKIEGAMSSGKVPPGALDNSLNTKSANLEFKAPAGKATQVYVYSRGKKSSITVAMKN